MAQYVQIPKDLNKVKDKFIGGLTKRQVICFSIGAALGGLTYYLTYKDFGTSTSGVFLFIVAAPFFLLGMYEKNGFTLDNMLLNYIRHQFIYPRVRVYETENIYSAMDKQIQLKREMKMLETGQKPVKSVKTSSESKRKVTSKK